VRRVELSCSESKTRNLLEGSPKNSLERIYDARAHDSIPQTTKFFEVRQKLADYARSKRAPEREGEKKELARIRKQAEERFS
jgi:hypothetical protein